MSEPGQFVPVKTSVVLQTVVEAMFVRVEQLREDKPPGTIVAVLEATDQVLSSVNDRDLDNGLRASGYAARLVEAEFFEPAKRAADWLPDLLRGEFARSGSWSEAVADLSGDLARAEPVGKPSPDDPNAASWRIPGPGGHVRHFLARRTIEGYLTDREEAVGGDPADLKRPWMYGFFVRACEEALPDEAAPAAPAS